MHKLFVGLFLSFIPLAVWATSSVTEAHPFDESLKPGHVVSLNDAGELILANQENVSRLFGVVVLPGDSAIRLQEQGEKTYVSTVGEAPTFVSDINGVISAGDKLTASPISGVGMKALAGDAVLGIALRAFNSETAQQEGVKQIQDAEGKPISVNIGTIPAQIQIAQGDGGGAISLITDFGERLAGKPVSASRLYTALVIFVVTTLIAGSILFGTFRSAITSLGRNPLSQRSVFRGVGIIIIVSLAIFAVGFLGAYLVLAL